jgi:hypothetical protein
LGISGGLASVDASTTYEQWIGQNIGLAAAQAQASSNLAQYQNPWRPERIYPTVSISAAEVKIRSRMAKLVDALPMSICSRITRVDFFPSFQETPARFVIVFDNDKEVSFTDIDNFPSDEHIAHVALVCP